jgi:tRNA(Ile)-lysidine synthase
MGPHPAVAAIRLAVRRVLHDILNDHHAAADRPASADRPVPTDRRVPADRRVSGERSPHERPSSPLVLVACSGGADSMGLASALAFEAPKLGIRAGGVTVDHGLQPGSDLRAEEVVLRLRELGLDPVESTAVTVCREGGPEAAARDARYAARKKRKS